MKINFYTIKNNFILNFIDKTLRRFNYYIEFEVDSESFIIQKIKIRKNYEN